MTTRGFLGDVVNRLGMGRERVFGPRRRLVVSPTASTQNALFNTSSGDILIGDYVFFGHDVKVITGDHDYRKTGHDRKIAVPLDGHDIIIERGAWVATGAIIIGPCRIGKDAVVAAGSVVTKDVPPRSVVAGNPAKIIKVIA